MDITKIFTFEGSHVVRNCTSDRCSHSVHGHSYKVEVCFAADTLDNAQMVMDFGLMKGSIKALIDAFDHTHVICSKDSKEYREFFKKHNDRWIEVPFNPSAEMLSLCLLRLIDLINEYTHYANGEGKVVPKSVTVHETATGRATSYWDDVENLWDDGWMDDIVMSDKLLEEMPKDLREVLTSPNEVYIENPTIKQQIEL